MTRVVDFHCHIVPADCLDMERSYGGASYGLRVAGAGAGRTVYLDGKLALGPGVPGQRWMHDDGVTKLWDVDLRLADMDAMGVDVQVIAVPPFMYYYGIPAEEAHEFSRRLNDGLAAIVRAHPDRFVALATVPLQDTDLAVAELTRAVRQLGMVGVEINTNVNGRNLDDPDLFPFFEAAAELGASIFLHPHTPAAHYGLDTDRFDRYYLKNLVGNPFETTLGLASLIFGGILERLPSLRVFCAHGGGNVPFNRGRWQFGWQEIPECQSIQQSPGTYIDRVFYDTITHYPPSLRLIIDTIGADRVVVGTDYPFDIGDFHPLDTVAAVANGDDRVRDQILGGNAAALIGTVPGAVVR